MALHDLTFARTFIVDPAQMQNPVDYDAHQFAPVWLTKLIGIGADSIERYDDIAGYSALVGIIESDYVGIVIMIEKLAVDLQYLFVVAEKVAYLPHSPALPGRYVEYPFFDGGIIERGHNYALAVP